MLASALPGLTACILAGCGATDAREQTSRVRDGPAHSTATTRATLYFLADGRTVPLGVRRDLERRPGAPTARLALEELLAGPTAAERRAGLDTAVPADTTIRSLRIEPRSAGSDAFVDLSGLPPADEAQTLSKVRVMTQVARTLIGLSDIARVRLRVDGRPWGLRDLQGNIRDDPIDYDRLRGFFHICGAVPGTEAGDCFTALP